MNLGHPDKIITAADLESLALEYLRPLPIPGVAGRTLDPDDAWETVLHAAVEQTSIHDICDQTTKTPCSDRVLEWLATVNHDEFEAAVNETLACQARQMLLKPTPRSICLDFVDIHYHGHHQLSPTELYHTTPRDGTSKCHRYCAAFVLSRGKPLILAFTWMHGVEFGLIIERLLADRAFASAAGIETMQTTAPMIAPLIRRGEKLATLLET